MGVPDISGWSPSSLGTASRLSLTHSRKRNQSITHPSSYLAPIILSPFFEPALLLVPSCLHSLGNTKVCQPLNWLSKTWMSTGQRSRRLDVLCALASYGWEGGVPTSQGRPAKSHRINCRQPYHPSSSSSSSSSSQLKRQCLPLFPTDLSLFLSPPSLSVPNSPPPPPPSPPSSHPPPPGLPPLQR